MKTELKRKKLKITTPRKTAMIDVITIGSSLVDIFVDSTNFLLKKDIRGLWLCEKFDDKIEVDSFQVCTGGGGSNTAVGFARLGFKTGVISELGMDTWAEVILADYQREGVETSFLIQEKKEETGGSIILNSPSGGRTALIHRGAASLLDRHDIPIHVLAQAGWIHLSSIAGREAALQQIFGAIQEYQRQLSWNPGKAELELLIAGKLNLAGVKIAVLFVNQAEWQTLRPIQAQLQQQCGQVVVTQGQAGGEVYQAGQRVFKFDSAATQVVDETGAGDSFAVGYVGAVLNGQDLEQQVTWGKKNAASVIGQVGAKAGLLTSITD